jgi:hypothetical protein
VARIPMRFLARCLGIAHAGGHAESGRGYQVRRCRGKRPRHDDSASSVAVADDAAMRITEVAREGLLSAARQPAHRALARSAVLPAPWSRV